MDATIAAMMAAQNKKMTPSVKRAIKASPAGMFPAVAAKSGITMGSKLGQAITKSGAGKLPAQIMGDTSKKKNLSSAANAAMKNASVKAGGKVIGSALGSAFGGVRKKR